MLRANFQHIRDLRPVFSCQFIKRITQSRHIQTTTVLGLKMNDSQDNFLKAALAMSEAKTLVVTAGAGIGVDSGLPDFRGPEGFWRAYPPLKKLGLTLPEMSTPAWFTDDPHFTWGFFGHRKNLYKATKPHKGFDILKNWADSMENGYFVFTSNVDGHFQKAGFDEDRVVECHGSINYLQQVNGRGKIWPFPDDQKVNVDENTLQAMDPLPTGPPDLEASKQQLARPNILMFGDWEFIETRTSEQYARFDVFVEEKLKGLSDKFVVIEIGAGLYVPTVRFQSERLVSGRKNGTLIRINPVDHDVPFGNHVSLPHGGLEALTKLKSELSKL